MRCLSFVPLLMMVLELTQVQSFSSQGFNAMQLLQQLGIGGLSSRNAPQVTVGAGKRKGDSPIYYIKLPPLPYFYSNEAPVAPPIASPVGYTSHPFHQVPVDFTNNGRPEQIYHWSIPQPSLAHQKFTSNVPPSPFVPPPQQSLSPPFRPSPLPPPRPVVHRPQDTYFPPDPYPSVYPPSKPTAILFPPGKSVAPPSFVPKKNSINNGSPEEELSNALSSYEDSPMVFPSKPPTKTYIKAPPKAVLNKHHLSNGKFNGVYVWRPKRKFASSKYKHPMFKHFNY